MNLIATKLHGYRKDGERFSCEDSLAEILIKKGAAVTEEQKVIKPKQPKK
jgi:hypothetical protein